jgi:hypothetical protein
VTVRARDLDANGASIPGLCVFIDGTARCAGFTPFTTTLAAGSPSGKTFPKWIPSSRPPSVGLDYGSSAAILFRRRSSKAFSGLVGAAARARLVWVTARRRSPRLRCSSPSVASHR